MEISTSKFVTISAISMVVLILPSHGQINTPCSPSMLSSFTPCMNFLTNSSANGTSPTRDCCAALRNLTSNGMDCMCLIVTGSVPFQLPVNRSLAISLPRACNMPGVPVQCKASSAPVPAPGPAALGPTASGIPPSASPTGSIVPEPAPSTLPPESDTTPPGTGTNLTPPSPDVNAGSGNVPTGTTGSSPSLNPTSAAFPRRISPSGLLFALAFLVFKHNY